MSGIRSRILLGWQLVWVIPAVASGCSFTVPAVEGQVGGDADADPDSSMTLEASVDAAGDCRSKWLDHSVTLTAPVPLASFNAALSTIAEERDPFVSGDELTLYFASNRAGSQSSDIYVSTRAAIGAAFTTPVIARDLSSALNDSRVSLTSNELTAVLSSGRAGGEGNTDLWEGTRPNKQAAFGSFTQSLVMTVNDAGEQLDPELSADGLRVYLAVSSNPQHIAMATRTTIGGAFGNPVSMIDSGTGDADPSLSADELVIAFSSNRTGASFGGGNVWYATRANTGVPFEPPQVVQGVNTPSNDGDPTFSRDMCRLYFASDRGIAGFDLFVSEVLP